MMKIWLLELIGKITGQPEKKKAQHHIASLAAKGYPDAMYVQGLQWIQDTSSELEPKKRHEMAMRLIREAAEKGSVEGMLQVATLYLKTDQKMRALSFLEKAHEKGTQRIQVVGQDSWT